MAKKVIEPASASWVAAISSQDTRLAAAAS
jgi:hypothetical protein